MNDKNLLRTGIVGSAVVALCCVTPVLVIALGLAAIVGWLDLVLFPLLAVFLGLTGYALYRRQRSSP